ncbi:MAG: TlpA family protein disulfide reductase, partial [Armatimonadetes bacterium]|nr:TlpA family protein disulfide reductase [Armatimonadota bacterium]
PPSKTARSGKAGKRKVARRAATTLPLPPRPRRDPTLKPTVTFQPLFPNRAAVATALPQEYAPETTPMEGVPQEAPVQASMGERPTLNVTDLQGRPLNLEQYRGKVVLIDFWASWCPPCRREAPQVVRLYNQYRSQGFEVIGISRDRDPRAMHAFIRQVGMSWRHHFDASGQVLDAYSVSGIPHTFLIGRDGRLIAENLWSAELARALPAALRRR